MPHGEIYVWCFDWELAVPKFTTPRKHLLEQTTKGSQDTGARSNSGPTFNKLIHKYVFCSTNQRGSRVGAYYYSVSNIYL